VLLLLIRFSILKLPNPAMESSQEIILRIESELKKNTDVFSEISVRHGISGIALFYLGLYLYSNQESYAQVARDMLFQSVAKLNSNYRSPIIFKEIAELGIAIEIFRKKNLLDGDCEHILVDFDNILSNEMRKQLASANFDPITGVLAQGQYFLERSGGLHLEIFDELREGLQRMSEEDENGLYWRSKLKPENPIYLGISHGIAAIIVFLIELEGRKPSKSSRDIVERAAKFILARQYKEQLPMLFPVIVNETYESDRLFSNNWCYGDPGTILALFKAARFLYQHQYADQLLTYLNMACTRELVKPYFPTGHSLLYGTSGLASILKKAAELSGNDGVEQSYNHSILKLSYSYNSQASDLGFSPYWNQDMRITKYSFAEGMAGIGLILMASEVPGIDDLYRPFFSLN
jgi:lantibiotic modifying enzyme